MEATLGFLKLCADHPSKGFTPSRAVDIGWHTFLMYTRGYQLFCDTRASRFIHHEPNDVSGRKMRSGGVKSTVKFMIENEIAFDAELWNLKAHDCTTEGCSCDDESCGEDPECEQDGCSGDE